MGLENGVLDTMGVSKSDGSAWERRLFLPVSVPEGGCHSTPFATFVSIAIIQVNAAMGFWPNLYCLVFPALTAS